MQKIIKIIHLQYMDAELKIKNWIKIIYSINFIRKRCIKNHKN